MQKWTIGICDDAREWYLKAEKIIRNFLKELEESIEILYFADEESLLQCEVDLNILFMDIELFEKDGNGIQLAKIFSEKQRDCQIVYLTNYLYYAVDVYETEHSYFVLKEQFEQRIEQIFEKIRHKMNQRIKNLTFSVINGGQIVLSPEEIYYFERNLRETDVVTESGNYKVWDKLDEIEKVLPKPDFVRCHNSYIVNLPNIREMQKNRFLIKDGSEIVISRGYMKAAKETFMKWAEMQS